MKLLKQFLNPSEMAIYRPARTRTYNLPIYNLLTNVTYLQLTY